MSIGFLIVFNGKVVPARGFVKLGCVIIGVLEVDSIVLFRDFYGLLYLSVALANFGVQVIAIAVFIEILGFINHTELNSHHRQLGLDLRFFFCLSDASGSSGELHVTYTNLSDIQSLALHAHNRHLLPNCRVLNVFDAFVGFIEISCCEMEGKVEN